MPKLTVYLRNVCAHFGVLPKTRRYGYSVLISDGKKSEKRKIARLCREKRERANSNAYYNVYIVVLCSKQLNTFARDDVAFS